MSAFEGTAARLAATGIAHWSRDSQHALHGSKHVIQRQVSDHSFQLMVGVRRV
jgi:hypothetical protein